MVIVADGRTKIDLKVLQILELMGSYISGIAKPMRNHRAIAAHIFEITTQVAFTPKLELKTCADGIVPTQILFLLKENNAKKVLFLANHRSTRIGLNRSANIQWFFNAVCETIQPKITFLLDCGTIPHKDAFMHLYRAFERNPSVGGACGEIIAGLGRFNKNLLNPLVAAQNFEYKMSNILDKPLESVFGYCSVLPGAFSAYRFAAITGRPLAQYFLGENPAASIYTSNLYLAEDRILCFELVTKKREPWILKYVKVE